MKDDLEAVLEEAGERPKGISDNEWLLLAYERLILISAGVIESASKRPLFACGFIEAEILERMKLGKPDDPENKG